ncbi:MAG: 3'-5' exonuclease [Chloroflexi bacterium]|nr:3'-5' exonuclease [Chloroflexota bacterium]
MTENTNSCEERYISVDIETAGPSPRIYSMLSIGACTVFEPTSTFYAELQPVNDNFLPQALLVSGLKMESLKARGLPPAQAMQQFAGWVEQVTPAGHKPVFVAFNAPFDWMFVNDYFHNYLGRNPFGHNALDVKAFFMGLTGSCWQETSMRNVTRRYFGARELTHHALRDALDQAEIFRRMLAEAREHSATRTDPKENK